MLLILSDGEDAQTVRLICDFFDERWTANRSITSVDWSTKVSHDRFFLSLVVNLL